jgi:hypothetical protein
MGIKLLMSYTNLITIYRSPSKFDSFLVSIYARLNNLETNTTCLKECYSMLHEHHDCVPINSEPSRWFPTVKVTINGETFHARCILYLNFVLCLKIFMNL